MDTIISSGISDDPTTWKVAMSSMRFDSPLEWLEALHTQDQAIYDAIGSERDRVLELAEQFTNSLSNDANGLPAARQREAIVAELRRLGMDVEQIARLVRRPTEAIMRLAYKPTPECNGDDVRRKLEAEKLLHSQPDMSFAMIGEAVGLPTHQVKYLAEKVGARRPQGNPPHVKSKVLELYDQGWKPKDIVEYVRQFVAGGEKLTASAVYQYVHRSGRSQKRAS